MASEASSLWSFTPDSFLSERARSGCQSCRFPPPPVREGGALPILTECTSRVFALHFVILPSPHLSIPRQFSDWTLHYVVFLLSVQMDYMCWFGSRGEDGPGPWLRADCLPHALTTSPPALGTASLPLLPPPCTPFSAYTHILPAIQGPVLVLFLTPCAHSLHNLGLRCLCCNFVGSSFSGSPLSLPSTVLIRTRFFYSLPLDIGHPPFQALPPPVHA